MTKLKLMVLITAAEILMGCTIRDSQYNASELEYTPTNQQQYKPGYNGYTYTEGYENKGLYDSGFGPAFWNPRYFYYHGND